MSEQEIEQLAEMFDTIVHSTNPAVQRSLQHTALLANLASEQENGFSGPFATMLGTLRRMQDEIKTLKRSVQILENNRTDPYPYYSPSAADYASAGLNALTTAQITALTAVDTISLGNITLTPIDMNNWSLNDINIIKIDNGTT